MNSKAPIYIFVASVVVAVGMLVFAVNRSRFGRSARFKSKLKRLPR